MRAAAASAMARSASRPAPRSRGVGCLPTRRVWWRRRSSVSLSPPTPMTCRPTTCRPTSCPSSRRRPTTGRPTTGRPTTCRPTTGPTSSIRPRTGRPRTGPTTSVSHQQPPVQSPPAQVPPFQAAKLRAGRRPRAGVERRRGRGVRRSARRRRRRRAAVPRACSREPRPVDRGQVWVVAGARAADGRGRRRARRCPGRRRRRWASASAEDRSSALTWSGVRSGRLCSSRATAPETTAAACEVPLPLKKRSPTRARRVRLVDVASRGRAATTIDRAGRDEVDPPARRRRGC